MNEQNRKNALLPSGFEDLLPPLAQAEYGAISLLMSVFSSFGYERVKPPMAEFEESLLGDGPGKALALETFRVMDPVTHRMLALRSDITAQIARIAQSRLINEPRPLRLTYANDVIRTKASQQRTLRQFTQVGCEMIGLDSLDSDIEVAIVALSGLSALGIKSITLDFAVPRLLDLLLAEQGLDAQEEVLLREALKGKQDDVLAKLGHKKVLAQLSDLLRMSGEAQTVLQKLDKLSLPKSAKSLLQRLHDVVDGVSSALPEMGIGEVSLTIDPLETRGFDYHSGVAFTVFAEGVRGEIGRGGRYTIFSGDRDAGSASGFTLYMDALRPVMATGAPQKTIFVPQDQSWTLVKNLQNEGWVVIRGLGSKTPPSVCTHVYKNGQIEEKK